MKKSLLFSLLAIFSAAIGFGGVSLAAAVDCSSDTAVAQIGEGSCYATISEAIENYTNTNGEIIVKKTTNENITTTSDVIINLNGQTLNACVVVNDGTLTIKDKDDNSGKILCSGFPFNVNAGTLKMYGGTYEDDVDIWVKGNGTKAEIYGGVYKSNDGNTAAVWAYNGGVIDIHDGVFIGKPGTEKDGKCFWAGGGQVAGDTNGTVNIYGGSFDGRLSASERSIYHIQGGSFDARNVAKTPECSEFVEQGQPINQQPGCHETNLDAFLVEGYAVHTENGRYVVSYDPVATIGGNGYSTVTGAITAAQDGEIVEILKAGTYTLPTLISHSITISGVVDGVIFKQAAPAVNGWRMISEISKNLTFNHVTFDLGEGAASGYFRHYFTQTNGAKIVMNNCTINGLITTMGDMDFNDCDFVQNIALYNIRTSLGNINFSGGTITNTNGYGYAHAHNQEGTGTRYTITFDGTKFINGSETTGKSAINIKETKRGDLVNGNQGYAILKYKVVINNVTTEGKFPTNKLGGSKIYMIDDVISGGVYPDGSAVAFISANVDSESYGTLTGGDIVVTLDGTKVYSTPKRDANGDLVQHTVMFDESGVVVADGAKVAKPVDPTKSCYTFSGWYNGDVLYDFNSVVTSNLTLTSKWKNYSCSVSSPSGGSSSSNPTNDNVNPNPTDPEKTTNEENGEINSELQNPETQEWYDNKGSQQEVLSNGLTREMNNAFEFAHRAGITTMRSAEEANMKGSLNRIAMAKMLSFYAINVLGQKPDTSKTPKFGDVSSDLDKQYNDGVTLAYQLGIMGVGITDFRPYDLVPRSEFVTALGRMLYKLPDGKDNYYSTHMAKLYKEGIIKNTNPSMNELRGYVMIMLMRSASKDNSNVNSDSNTDEVQETTGNNADVQEKKEIEVENYFFQAYQKGDRYTKIGYLQEMLKYYGYYNGNINNTYDNNTIDAVYDFQIAMGVLDASDVSNPARGWMGPSTREVLNKKWAEYKSTK